MHKRYLNIISVFLCLVVLCSIPAHAAEPYASSQIATHSATLDKGSDGYLYIIFTITTNRVMNRLGASSVEVQRYVNSKWTTEYTYTVDNTPLLQTSNESYYALVIPYRPQYPNGTYRALVNLYAQSDTMISTGTDITNTVP